MTRKTENEAFSCAVCGRDVKPIAHGTIRDHCPHCLCSLHVDVDPGDRACTCHGVLDVTSIDQHPKKGFVFGYTCRRCSAEKRNRMAPDDDMDVVLKLMRRLADSGPRG